MPASSGRPLPPASVLSGDIEHLFVPAPEVWDWIQINIINNSGGLHNQDHHHLLHANIGVLWTSVENSRKGRRVIGTAEEVAFRCGKWQKARQEMQMVAWFGCPLPDFLITLDAMFCQHCSDTEFCALVEHELYHCGQKFDAFGAPKFSKDTGRPQFELKGHDVEEFIGVVRRYGTGNSEGKLAQLVNAANSKPEVAKIDISRACGTCQLRLAS